MNTAASALSTCGVDLAHARVLVIAPHPDDESLALGGLIQQAVRERADVTVLQVTDGDNNPWPQRWLERRWRIGAAERRRWAHRRVGEMHDAIRHLGLSAAASRRLGWPDLGVVARLQQTGMAAVETFAGVVAELEPDIVVVPALDDRHPDHAASHVLMRLALARLQRPCICLTYRVHGRGASEGMPVTITLNAAMRANKRRAILAHRSQVALARRRLLANAGPTEHLCQLHPPAWTQPDAVPPIVALPWSPSRSIHPWLRLTVAHPDGVQTWRWSEAPGLRRDRHAWQWALPPEVVRPPCFARLEMHCRSPWIFDHWGWCDLTAATAAVQAGD